MHNRISDRLPRVDRGSSTEHPPFIVAFADLLGCRPLLLTTDDALSFDEWYFLPTPDYEVRVNVVPNLSGQVREAERSCRAGGWLTTNSRLPPRSD
jgi:hypothetical protein